jgi:hypothetical protein
MQIPDTSLKLCQNYWRWGPELEFLTSPLRDLQVEIHYTDIV